MGIVFLVVLILTVLAHTGWSLAVIVGILFVGALILSYLEKDNDLVIDDRGIHQQADWKAALTVLAVHTDLLI